MRKHQQRQILELLKTLESAQAESLFADCQDGAIAVGEFIEDLMGEGTETVALLEEYCDLIFKAHNGEIGEKPLKKQLVKIRNSVNFELKPDKIEIAFLSYKASMSDSLESIYLAAKEDPDCDAYWIPIPYDSRNPDGTVKEHFFEGADCYPDYLECVDWQKYDLEERHPDVIFTFAPYDGYNYVSRVHPDFYCERLKHLTDCLVYVPYFVAGEDIEDHFATLQGCIHADKVVVQSEKLREVYIKAYKKSFANEHGKPEDKFVALGSPKFDKVVNSKREDFTLPKDWENLIGGKKVILYNTSIGAILQGGELYLQKLRYVLEAFRNRGDVVLWWRPHPLSESTYRSMRAMLADEYLKIVNDYRAAGYGIFDDTTDLHRSITYSDAYYGDASSVAALYMLTGKPVIHQTVFGIELHRDSDKPAVTFVDFIFDEEGNGLAYSLFFNGLFKLNFEENSAKLMAKDEEAYFSLPYIYPAENKGQLTLFPYYSKNILECDLKTGDIHRTPLLKEYSDKSLGFDTYTINRVLKCEKGLYAFGQNEGVIIAYFPESGEVEYHTKLRDAINERMPKGKTALRPTFIHQPDEEKIMILPGGSGQLALYNLKTQEVTLLAYNEKLEICEAACFDGEYLWFVTKEHDAVRRWDYINDEMLSFDNFPQGFMANKDENYTCFSAIIDCGAYLLMLPVYANMAVKLEKATGDMKHAKAFPVLEDAANKVFKYDSYCRQRGEKLFVCARWNSTVYEFDPENLEDVTPHRFTISDKDYDKCMKNATAGAAAIELPWSRYVLNDAMSFGSPAEFISKLLPINNEVMQKQREAYATEAENADGTAGRKILEMCKN